MQEFEKFVLEDAQRRQSAVANGRHCIEEKRNIFL